MVARRTLELVCDGISVLYDLCASLSITIVNFCVLDLIVLSSSRTNWVVSPEETCISNLTVIAVLPPLCIENPAVVILQIAWLVLLWLVPEKHIFHLTGLVQELVSRLISLQSQFVCPSFLVLVWHPPEMVIIHVSFRESPFFSNRCSNRARCSS